MDVLSHALAGAATGAMFNMPLVGALFAIIPDVPALGPRKPTPNTAYRFNHSLLGVLALSLIAVPFGLNYWLCALLALLSHIVLDMPTHGATWSPRLMYPFNKWHCSYFEEWEWFNETWVNGLALTFLWSITCLLIAL